MTETRSIGEWAEGLAFGAVGVIVGLIGSLAPGLFLLLVPGLLLAVFNDLFSRLINRFSPPARPRDLAGRSRAFVLTPLFGGLIAGGLWGLIGGGP